MEQNTKLQDQENSRKLSVLASIAERFNRAGITWAVGASLLLYFKKRTDTFHDIDLMIAEADVEKTKEILSEMGVLQPPNPSAQYQTRTFLEYVIDQTDVDVMAGFVIVKDGKSYDCALHKEEIVDEIEVFGQKIPLQSLELWGRYYRLMGREEKACICEKTL